LVKHKKIIATDHLLKNKEKENEFDQPNNSSKEGPENEIIQSHIFRILNSFIKKLLVRPIFSKSIALPQTLTDHFRME
jgi:hypothetical protein